MKTRLMASPIHAGIATHYDAAGAGTCSFAPSPADVMVEGMNAEEYDNAALCGAQTRATGAKGGITVRIVDLCLECKAGHLDLSSEAFALMSKTAA